MPNETNGSCLGVTSGLSSTQDFGSSYWGVGEKIAAITY